METKANDVPCQNVKKVPKIDETITVSKVGLLCRKALTDGAIKTILPDYYGRALLFHGYCPRLARHSETGEMYAVLRRTYYWPLLTSDGHELVPKCESRRRHRPSPKYQRWLQLFSRSKSLEFVAINILEPLTKPKQGNWFIIVITDRSSKLTRPIPIPNKTAPHAAVVVLENRIINHDVFNIIMTDDGPQFVSNIFTALWAANGMQLNTTKEYHSQANRQAEMFNKTLKALLQHFTDEHQTN